MSECVIVDYYDESADRVEAECYTHGVTWSGSQWHVDDAVDKHKDANKAAT